MKIDGYSIIRNLESYLSRGVEQAENSALNKRESKSVDAVNSDNVEISYRAVEFNRIKRIINEVPEIREGKVEELKNDVGSGRYELNTDIIASSLLREHIMDAILAPSLAQ